MVRRTAIWWWLLCLWAGAAAGRLTCDDSRPLGSRQAVVLIHGWNADASVWTAFLRAAASHPRCGQRCRFYRFEYDWSRPVRDNAAQLAAELAGRAELRDRPVVLVGHSMGGLVARDLAEEGRDSLARLAAIYTLGTPHHGTPAANVGWLAHSSRYASLLALFPSGLVDLLGRADIFRALRTEGGRDLGWDNADQRMPADVWLTEGRWLAEANRRFATLPGRAEWLRRYRLVGSYLTEVGDLGLWTTTGQLRGGRALEAGAAILAHGFRDGRGVEISAYAISDGIVPLESALWLQPGPALARDNLNAAAEQRQLQRGVVKLVAEGLDHSQLISEVNILRRVQDQLAEEDANALTVDLGGSVGFWRPGWARPRPVAEGRLLGATTDRLAVAAPDGLRLVSPDGSRLVAPGPGVWAVDAGLRQAASADGLLLGLAEPRLVRRLGTLDNLVWSPDGRRLAARREGRVVLIEADSAVSADAGEGYPLAWSHDSATLLVADQPGGSAVRRVGAGPPENLSPLPARDQAQSGDRLAWLPAEPGAELRVGISAESAARIAAPHELDALAALPEGRFAVLGHDSLGSRLLCFEAATGSFTPLATTRYRVSGPLTVSPDGRYVAAIWPDNEIWIAATDGGESQWLPGRAPHWLPLPAWRGLGEPLP